MKPLIFLLCTAFLLGSCASDDDGSEVQLLPPQLEEEPGASATLEKPPASELRLGSFSIKLATTTLGEVQRALGAGSMQQQAGEEGATFWLCYTVGLAEAFDRVWLVSTPTGGPEHRIGTIIGEITSVGGDQQCPLLPSTYQPSALDSGIWLRIPRETLVTKLGQPSSAHGTELTYSFAGEQSVAQAQGEAKDFDVTSTVVAELQGGYIARLTATKTAVED